jgi:3-deoxy-D-manno-octulosonic-acid transferase
MILFFYNLGLLVALVVSAPWWLWKMATTHKYREGLLARLGWAGPVRRRLGIAVSSPRAPQPIWLHAVSVGEVLAATRLVRELEIALPEHPIIVSTTTRTGQALARERFDANRVFYCPLDLPWAVRAYLNALQPRMLILAETEFWPNLLSACHRRGIPVAVVNARISDRSWPRYRRLRLLWKPFLSRLSRVLAQTETDAERLLELGCRAVSVSGNLKFDVRIAAEAEATRLLRAASAGLQLIVAGSTLDGEESALLTAWPQVLAAAPQSALLLAPRHPERFAAVAALLQRSGFSWSRRSQWPENELPALQPGGIVLLDTIGELASVYSLASVAFVGGSLIPAGGHNPLEPAQFSVPIVMGPHTNNFRAMVDDLLAHQALRVAGAETLAQTLRDLLQNREEAAQMGRRARAVFDQQAGATRRSIEALMELLQPPIEKNREPSLSPAAPVRPSRRRPKPSHMGRAAAPSTRQGK